MTKRKRQKTAAIHKQSAPVGAPTSYTPEKAEHICQGLIEGRKLTEICQDLGMPTTPSVIFRWRMRHPEFATLYAQARQEQTDAMGHEIVDIADKSTPETVHVDKLRVDSRKWVMARLNALQWGDRLAVDQTTTVKDLSEQEITDRLERLAAADPTLRALLERAGTLAADGPKTQH